MNEFENHQGKFLKEGFTKAIIETIGEKALLTIWDMFEIFKAVKQIPEGGTYLEIGCHLGGSLVCAYESAKASGKSINFISIDPFTSGPKDMMAEIADQFRKNTEHIKATHYQKHSHLVKDSFPNNSLDMIFIDGDHSYIAAKNDFIDYWPKLKTGGVLLAHDFNYSRDHIGVVTAVMDVFALQEIVKPFRSSIAIIRKEPENESLWVFGN
ncbi:MAG: class I SAM-dependent methyltransferase [Candidatus Omnitrophica bacterium]|nr:class I SAM-dependent methyltransferase [Candidatus Omnitrophota bacterium]MDD5592675.1 class I SAM-dependent methyltransferase [Candidatus Omnitrophota bacterium]